MKLIFQQIFLFAIWLYNLIFWYAQCTYILFTHHIGFTITKILYLNYWFDQGMLIFLFLFLQNDNMNNLPKKIFYRNWNQTAYF